MENQYGIIVTNKYDLFIDDDADPLELLAQQEEAKKKRDEQAKKDAEKGKGKPKSGKKPVLQTENKNKPSEQIVPKKEEKLNTSKPGERSRGGRQNRDSRDNRENRDSRDNRDQHNDTDRRPPRRRDDNFNSENRERSERSEGGFGGGFSRPERTEGGGGFGRGEGGFGRSDRGRGLRRGGRGGRGGPGGARGGFGKREFERHSGSDRTSGVKATDKREGGGAHNWGTVKDDIEPPPKVDYWKDPKEQMRDNTNTETTPDWNPQTEDVENQDPNESTESVPAEDDSPKQMTLDEWKKQQEKNRVKSEFKLRRAGEGVDNSQWKNGRVYRKSEGEEEEHEDEEESDEETEEELRNKRLVNEIKITFNDSPRRGRGGRRGARGPRGGGTRGGGGRGSDRRNQMAAPKFDDDEFPSLVKQEA